MEYDATRGTAATPRPTEMERPAAEEPHAAGESRRSPGTSDGAALAALGYLLGFVSGLVCLHLARDGFARFHAAQSVALSVVAVAATAALTVVGVLLSGALRAAPGVGFDLWLAVGGFLSLCHLALLCGALAGTLLGMVGAARGSATRLPVVAPLADRIAEAVG